MPSGAHITLGLLTSQARSEEHLGTMSLCTKCEMSLAVEWHLHVVIIREVVNVGCFDLYH